VKYSEGRPRDTLTNQEMLKDILSR
jgi:hypothetical protein